jgi:hypothetical protein
MFHNTLIVSLSIPLLTCISMIFLPRSSPSSPASPINAQNSSQILCLVAGVLHLGNLEFRDVTVSQTDGSEITEKEALLDACANFGLEDSDLTSDFEKALISRTLKIGGKLIETPNTKVQAENTRNSLAKLFYGKRNIRKLMAKLFTFAVREISGSRWRSCFMVMFN